MLPVPTPFAQHRGDECQSAIYSGAARSPRLNPMGMLSYDSKLSAPFDDRVLAHLQVVFWAKLRRGESFAFTWSETAANGSGRKSIWVAPGIPIAFEYFGSKQPMINARWVQALNRSANSAGGMQIVPEPPAEEPPAPTAG